MLFVMLAAYLCLICPPAQAQDAADQVNAVLSRLESAISAEFSLSLPLPAASAGVSYSFDPATGNFQRDPATFGQIYLDRADPLGAGRLNLSFLYQFAKLDELEGMNADNLHNREPIPLPGLLAAVQIPNLSFDAAVHSFLFAASYGITDDLEASVAVPLEYSNIHLKADIVAAAISESGELVILPERINQHTHPVGIGDVMARLKYRLFSGRELHAAAGLLLRFPTGDKHDLQGTGYTEVAPALLASTRMFHAADWARFQSHLNVTVGFNADHVNSSEARWGYGVDWGITDDATVSVSFLGRHPFSRIGPAGSFEFPSCDTDVVTCAADPSARDSTTNIFGLTGDRANAYTATVGGRAGLWRDTLFALINVAVPLNDALVRTWPVPLIGLEATF